MAIGFVHDIGAKIMGLLQTARGIILALGVALAAPPAAANDIWGFTVEEYEKFARTQSDHIMFWYAYGMSDGLLAAREYYRSVGEAPLFCLSDDKDLGATGVRILIHDELKADRHTWTRVSNMTIEKIALYSLRRKYPCGEARSKPGDHLMTIANYRIAREKLENRAAFEATYSYFFGMRASIAASGDAYVERGAKRRICFPSDGDALDLIKAADEELERNAAAWKDRQSENMGLVAVQAFARKWPCK